MALLSGFSSMLGSVAGIVTSAIEFVEVQQPSAIPWETLILSVFDFVAVYGWRIILFTLILKIVLSPLDFFSRYKMRQNSRIMESIKDKLEAIDRQFSDPLERMRAKSAIQKQAGIKQFVACLPMLISPIIFIWMSVSMSNINRYKNVQQYVNWYNVYQAAYSSVEGPENTKISAGQDAVLQYYAENRVDNFLWIKSIWESDVPWKKPIKDGEAFKTAVGDYATKNPQRFVIYEVDEDGNKISEGTPMGDSKRTDFFAEYEIITDSIRNSSNNSANGYLILVVIAAGVSYLSFRSMQSQQRMSGMSLSQSSPFSGSGFNSNTTMKVMQFMMPVMYLVFALIQSAMFTIYMIASSAISLGLQQLSLLIIKFIEKKKDHDEVTKIQRYGRPDPQELKNKEK